MSKKFIVPGQKQQKQAIGPLSSESQINQKALSSFHLHFNPIPAPSSSDWLGCHTEKGQSFESFRQTSRLPSNSKKIFYIQPLNDSLNPSTLHKLHEFASTFFPKVSFSLRDPMNLGQLKVKNRLNSGVLQYNAGTILKKLQKNLPIDAYAMIGIMLEDIYHNEHNNFVFGLGSGKSKTGVFSFARYDEGFYGGSENFDLLEYRAVKVMIHEMCHMFGMAHCIFFHCLMNGSNHIDETDAKPFYLCPVCIRKVCYVMKLDVDQWYRGIIELAARAGRYFEPATEWYSARLSYIIN